MSIYFNYVAFEWLLFQFCNSEVMTLFPHSLVWTRSEFLNLHNFLINWLIFIKIVAKCSAFNSLSYKEHVTVNDPIPFKS